MTPDLHRWLAATAGAVLLAAAADARADHHMAVGYTGDLGLGFDDNVGNSAYGYDIQDSAFVSGGLHAQLLRRFGSHTGLLLRGSFQAQAYEAFDGLNNGKATALVRLLHRPEGGFFMPTFATWVSGGLWEFDSRLRDSTELRAGVYMLQPLNTAFTARFDVTASERAADSAVFDTSTLAAAINVDWRITGESIAYLGYQFIDGDAVSTANSTMYHAHYSTYSDAYDWDDVFGGVAGDRRAYRLDSESQVATLGLNIPFSGSVSFDAQLMRVDSQAVGGTSYERLIAVTGLLARF